MTEDTATPEPSEPVAGPVQRPVRPGAQWDDERCAELELLQRLVREVSSINSGNRCLQRIAECIEMAEKLSRTNYDTARPGLVRWLHELAISDRFGPRA